MKKNNYQWDYVYNTDEENCFKSLHVLISMKTGVFTVVLSSEEKIEEITLNKILLGLQRDYFDKLRLNVFEECEIFLIIPEGTHIVTFFEEDEKTLCKISLKESQID